MSLNCFIFLVFLAIGLTHAQQHWGYPNLDKKEEFEKWGGTCDSGTQQSPIDLRMGGALKGVFQDFDFQNYNKKSSVQMVNNGHSIQLMGFDNGMQLSGGPLRDEYVVEQLHLHWWSEHTVENIRYPLEVHIVHRNKRYPNMDEATKQVNGVAVIGILYHFSNQENSGIKQITQHLDEVKSFRMLEQNIKWNTTFVLRELFPEINGYFTYEGSLTTPGCAEAVIWLVLKDTFPVTKDQLQKFQEVEYQDGKKLKNNYRNIQDTNNRAIIFVGSSYRSNAVAFTANAVATICLLLTARLLQ